MKRVLAGVLGALLSCTAFAAEADLWIDPVDVAKVVPSPPAQGSRIEQEEIVEIHRAQSAALPPAKALAQHDNDIENPTIFSDVIGWDLPKLPKTKFLMSKIMEVDRAESDRVKAVFSRTIKPLSTPIEFTQLVFLMHQIRSSLTSLKTFCWRVKSTRR